MHDSCALKNAVLVHVSPSGQSMRSYVSALPKVSYFSLGPSTYGAAVFSSSRFCYIYEINSGEILYYLELPEAATKHQLSITSVHDLVSSSSTRAFKEYVELAMTFCGDHVAIIRCFGDCIQGLTAMDCLFVVQLPAAHLLARPSVVQKISSTRHFFFWSSDCQIDNNGPNYAVGFGIHVDYNGSSNAERPVFTASQAVLSRSYMRYLSHDVFIEIYPCTDSEESYAIQDYEMSLISDGDVSHASMVTLKDLVPCNFHLLPLDDAPSEFTLVYHAKALSTTSSLVTVYRIKVTDDGLEETGICQHSRLLTGTYDSTLDSIYFFSPFGDDFTWYSDSNLLYLAVNGLFHRIHTTQGNVISLENDGNGNADGDLLLVSGIASSILTYSLKDDTSIVPRALSRTEFVKAFFSVFHIADELVSFPLDNGQNKRMSVVSFLYDLYKHDPASGGIVEALWSDEPDVAVASVLKYTRPLLSSFATDILEASLTTLFNA